MNIPPTKTIYIAYELEPKSVKAIVENTYPQPKPSNILDAAPDGLIGTLVWGLVVIVMILRFFGF